MTENEQLLSEVKEFFSYKGIDNTVEKISEWIAFANFQMEQETYWSPCEDCDNPSCRKKEDFPIWFCPDNR